MSGMPIIIPAPARWPCGQAGAHSPSRPAGVSQPSVLRGRAFSSAADGGQVVRAVRAQVAALGEVLAEQPVGVLVRWPLPRAGLVAEEHRHAQRGADLAVQRHLLALVPGQRPAQPRRELAERGDQRVADRLGGVPARQVQQDRVPRCPVHQGADGGPVGRPSDQVAFPVPGLFAAGGLGGPLADHGHGGDPVRAALARPAVRPAPPPAGAQRRAGSSRDKPAELGPVDRLVDRLVHDMPRRLTGELAAQRLADLLRAPPLLQPAGHELPQHLITRRSCPPAAGRAAGRPAYAR